MNGVVTDTEAFCEGIRAAWKENRLPKSGVILSVDGNHVTVKKTQLPRANRKRTGEMLAYDFQDTNAGGPDWVYGSMDLGPAAPQGTALPSAAGEKDKAPGEERELLAATAEKAYVTELAEAFAQAKMCIRDRWWGTITASWSVSENRGKPSSAMAPRQRARQPAGLPATMRP